MTGIRPLMSFWILSMVVCLVSLEGHVPDSRPSVTTGAMVDLSNFKATVDCSSAMLSSKAGTADTDDMLFEIFARYLEAS